MKKYIVLLMLALILGFFIGRISVATPPAAESESTEIVSQYLNLERNAKKDLANASTSDQQLKELQKLREEIFQIFLANIALKIDKKFWSKVDLSPQPTPNDSGSVANPEPKVEAKPTVVENVAEVKKESTTQSEERNIQNNTQSEILKDPNAYYSSSKLISTANNRLMQNIQGAFKGYARMSDPKNKVWKITINSSLNFLDNNWSGSVSIEIADEYNVVFSNSNGRGSNNNFYQNPNDPGAIIVEASPDIFLYLRWMEGRQSFWGSVFKKTGKDKNWKLVGKMPYLARE